MLLTFNNIYYIIIICFNNVIMNNKTGNFDFKIKEQSSLSIKKKNLGGRPTKDEVDKLSIQKNIKFTEDEYNKIINKMKNKKNYYNTFSSYMRYLIFKSLEQEV